ncbi:hypothetical protein ACRAWF_26940 [Streptomyces sp. L7]
MNIADIFTATHPRRQLAISARPLPWRNGDVLPGLSPVSAAALLPPVDATRSPTGLGAFTPAR